MKKLEFETSKGKFLLVDAIEKPNIHTGIKLSEITEEQASDIVFRIGYHSNDHLIPSAKQILHSLLKSKGIHLFENPNDSDYFTNRSTEQKTFYNPYIFSYDKRRKD